MRGLFPFLGGLLLLGAFVIAAYQYAQPDYGSTTLWGIGGVFIIGIGTLLVGAVLMVIWSRIAPAFFKGQTLSQRSHSELILVAAPFEEETVRLPDSGLPDLVIAPDLSNLPPGMHAYDLESGVEVDSTSQLRALRSEQDIERAKEEFEAEKEAEQDGDHA
jgi:hypothetical protein